MARYKYLTIAFESAAGREALCEEGWNGWEMVAVWCEPGFGPVGLMKRRVGFLEYLHDTFALWWANFDYR